MRNKTKSLKKNLPHPSLLSGLIFTTEFSTFSPQMMWGDWERGLWSIHQTLSLLLLPPHGEDSSHSSTAPACGPSHEKRSSTNCPSVGPSHKVQSFRNRLLHRGSPTGSQALPANLLQCGLLSLWVHRSWQEPAPAQASHRVTASFRHPPAVVWGPFHGLQVEICSTMDRHGTACLTMVFIMCCRGTSAPAPGVHPAPPSSLTLVSAELFLLYSHSSLPAAVVQQFFFPS